MGFIVLSTIFFIQLDSGPLARLHIGTREQHPALWDNRCRRRIPVAGFVRVENCASEERKRMA